MTPIKFEEYKQQITQTIDDRLRIHPIPDENNGFTLVEGFITQPLNKEISGSLIIGGPAIPLVAIVGNSSGRIYYFALKALIPNLQI